MKIHKVLAWISIMLLLTTSTGFSLGQSIIIDEDTDFKNETDYPFNETYPSVEELYGWYGSLESEYPDLVKKYNIGRSWEGRDIWVLEITSSEDTRVDDKPAILIDGGLHAREWSSIQVASYFAWRILSEYRHNDTIYWMVNNRRIFVCPLLNPDGYLHDGNGAIGSGRSWRKNRNDSTLSDSVGVDLNRNWDIYWEYGDDEPQSQTYRGEFPFSENETSALKDFILENNIQSYQNLHSFGGYLLIPWSHSPYPTQHDDWYREVAEKMVSQTTLYGNEKMRYSYGRADEEIGYSATGTASDWVYDSTGAHSFTFEIYTSAHRFYPPYRHIMRINQDLDEALIFQSRITDVDLGDGDKLLFPPTPYLVYGRVVDSNSNEVSDRTVSLTNRETDESISIKTDNNGYFELNLANLLDSGYQDDDNFILSVDNTSLNFTVDETWGSRFDLTTSHKSNPSVVENIEIIQDDGVIELTWDVPDDRGNPIYRYNIYRDGKLIGHSNDNYYLDTEPETFRLYTYQISAVNSGGEGPRSEEVDVFIINTDFFYYVVVGAAFFALFLIVYKKRKYWDEDEQNNNFVETSDKDLDFCPNCKRELLEEAADSSAYCNGCEFAIQDFQEFEK